MIPDKIYIGTVTLSSNTPSEEHLLPDWHLRPNPKVANVEYIRKDKIIEVLESFSNPTTKLFVNSIVEGLNEIN